MKTIYQHIEDLKIEQWHYYHGIDNRFAAQKPFVDSISYTDFIRNYFTQGQKVEIFENSRINPSTLRLPEHICSVFMMGIIFHENTSLRSRIKPGTNDPGYQTFPFIWFLTALFHDNAYQMEDKQQLTEIHTLPDLIAHFDITHNLFAAKFKRCRKLMQVRGKYFLFRKKQFGVVDHGLLGGLLLYDRLVKIRRAKHRAQEGGLFWGIKLENQYRMAADAISIHNIWIQKPEIVQKYDLTEFINFEKIKLNDFPLFYLLAIVDTLEPVKEFKKRGFSEDVILKSINLSFKRKSIEFSKSDTCLIDFGVLVSRLEYFNDWIDIKTEIGHLNNSFKITFK
ncbi:hypothetical protein [Flavobacterium panici]|uniref:Uncharacterized protein n=1 Tax=Flavobacterium panici TaxID=2654843 RepID=A0A9N8P1T0_9FLAO|nr:hypothetical protein [Flavobacterium panici]CAC9974388.1 hypothetical protein FLAPXU55_02085 [Flavobacterium panici]